MNSPSSMIVSPVLLRCVLLVYALALSACASQGGEMASPPNDAKPRLEQAASKAQGKTETAVFDAVRTPFSDLNLVRKDIPAVLKAAHKAPYAIPADVSCDGLVKEVEALDATLGADLDTPATASNPSLIERGVDALGDSAGGAIRGAVEGLIPYRSWLRRLSGAERYSREVLAAIAAGTVRRAFIKGMGQSQGCSQPAAPRPPA